MKEQWMHDLEVNLNQVHMAPTFIPAETFREREQQHKHTLVYLKSLRTNKPIKSTNVPTQLHLRLLESSGIIRDALIVLKTPNTDTYESWTPEEKLKDAVMCVKAYVTL